MSLCQLSLTDFRNLQSTTLDFHPGINLIYGENGSGKTSLLEAIHICCQAQSFRQHHLVKCISHESNRFLIFGKYENYKAGLSKSDKRLDIRVNGESISRQSELARLTPVKIFNTDTFELLTGPPEFRRRYLDWCLFHVEQSYNQNWLNFRHALRQRNKLLKDRRDLHLLEYWDDFIVEPSTVLSYLRGKYCENIAAILVAELGELLGEMDISLEYQPGWNISQGLLESLQVNRQRDIRSGYTGQGVHRDNIIILSQGRPVKDVLSRGQLKRLTLVLLIAVLKIVSSYRKNPTILLIDDLKAEIDEMSESIIYSALSSINLQTFITNISQGIPAAIKGKEFKMFHVEHGMIKPRKFS
ncbi:MAG: DNA replication/repair protein RecF [Gammaproteobacteria bacterium]|nr:DNA replication/repair protein RecF [Gammaproteobacteria bacterium]